MKLRIETTYKSKKGTETNFSSDDMSAEKALVIAEDLQKTGRIKNIHFLDNYDSTWTLKELQKYLEEIETEPHNISVYFDGGFDLQSKMSGLGCAIYYEQNGKSYRLRKNRHVDSLDSNNEAEYGAFHLGVLELESLGAQHQTVSFIGDSQVVINQLNGEWACMEQSLNRWADRIEEKLQQLGISAEYTLVSRKQNQEADQLASQALNKVEISSKMEILND
ncbi:ribonuclease H family protein [Evansella sp. AB-P1]|uniref:ribonuclease H family protein n=1 Tax=Evansella sp. AB-P1 TaxID=3037653 RepID=UPI00241E9A5A|nr:ribonuclease H family protein [Evansella sp. AB-P1]MDG5787113.1 ribonuclease H family protein [Evansella sp. AB-P1]